VEDLLNFSRKSETEKKMLDIHQIIEDVITFVQHHSDIENITLEKKYNLVVNAIHAVGKKGHILISTDLEEPSGDLMVNVRDDGHGIEKKHLKNIFDPFFTTKPTGEGTGLGLSVSYGIIKHHGGHIFVESKPEAGTTFTFTLPAISIQQEI